MSRQRARLWRTYRAPSLLATLTLAGLVSALIGDGPLDLLSWLSLGALITLVVLMLRRR